MSRPENEPPFQEPWQAQALATALGLQEAGIITVTEWSEALGVAIKNAQAAGDPDAGDTYYNHVLEALETLLRDKSLIGADELSTRKAKWKQAYLTTPHGQPVALKPTASSKSL
ncbi:MAG: nitrile hydratase accessory protein [Gammaproteobacteria bacterium]|nr:nitrile hydratase accessory protein [Gammaproteobacteria bacterium]